MRSPRSRRGDADGTLDNQTSKAPRIQGTCGESRAAVPRGGAGCRSKHALRWWDPQGVGTVGRNRGDLGPPPGSPRAGSTVLWRNRGDRGISGSGRGGMLSVEPENSPAHRAQSEVSPAWAAAFAGSGPRRSRAAGSLGLSGRHLLPGITPGTAPSTSGRVGCCVCDAPGSTRGHPTDRGRCAGGGGQGSADSGDRPWAFAGVRDGAGGGLVGA